MLQKLPGPEILPPEREVQVWRWRVTPRTAKFIKIGTALPAIGVAGYFVQNFLQLRGIVNLLLSRIDLALVAGCVLIAGCALTIGVRKQLTWRIAIFITVVGAAFAIDWLSPKPPIEHARLEIGKVIPVPLSEIGRAS